MELKVLGSVLSAEGEKPWRDFWRSGYSRINAVKEKLMKISCSSLTGKRGPNVYTFFAPNFCGLNINFEASKILRILETEQNIAQTLFERFP